MTHSILVAVDSSPTARYAVNRAGLLAARLQSRVTLLHVVARSRHKPELSWFGRSEQTDLQVAQAQATLGRYAAALTRDHDVHTTVTVRTGDAFEQLYGLANKSDLLVIGVKADTPFDFVLGASVERLIRLSRRPILVTKSPAAAPYSNVLVPTDFAVGSEALLRVAFQLAAGASVEVFHALSTQRETKMQTAHVPAQAIQKYMEGAIEKCMRRLEAMAATVNSEAVRFSMGQGEASSSCLKRLTETSADLLVMGKEGQSLMGNFLMGSVARQLVAKAPCDVLIVPRAALPQLNGESQDAVSGLASIASQPHEDWICRGAGPVNATPC